ncbi:MAG: rRNA maturation RNase YbeY [Candidatus Nitronauta litoralis]|uniref:Endoribonuclease YbeY n=1 Tax=Candidatus Nitronauta litoralis TaxID=2705533 RepID=A0A7T0G0Q3_9BACT|nr:MAG: rRNA maturation RNase YbeY [Candidatus Nitronauta litoralis]
MEVLVRNAQRKIALDKAQVKSRTIKVLKALKLEKIELSVLITNDVKIRELNYNYREQDKPTDVLSFPQEEDAIDENGYRLLGDVVLSAETAKKQAEEHHLTLDQELMLLIIHGVLHLLGYDHEQSRKDAAFMKKKTKTLFLELFPGVLPSGTSNF